MKDRIGVYICHCGGNISDYVDVDKVKAVVKDEPGVCLAKTMLLACADSAQKEMVEDIKTNNLDAIVVASCSPKLHQSTFRAAAQRGGLNPYNYVQVNVREQGSWAHADNPATATDKAMRLVRAGIARVRYSEALSSIKIPALNTVCVVGAGVSGMRCAIELADMGTRVYLVEKDHFVGGRVPQWGELFSTDENGEKIAGHLFEEIKKRENITLFTGAELESLSGCIGSFQIKIKINPRYVLPGYNKDKLQEAIDKCPADIPDAFNFDLIERKAIYKPYPSAFPDIPVLDMDSFSCPEGFAETYKDCIDLNQKSETLDLKAGAIILNSGFEPYEPKELEYGYKKTDRVITLQQFRRLIELNEKKLMFKGKEIKNAAFIYCVGSRQKQGENKYCSRYCCTSAIHTALLIKKKYKNTRSFHLYRDIRTYGKQEILYEESSKQGDIYLKFHEDEPPVVADEGGNCVVRVKDLLTDGEEIEIYPDMVVLVTGMVPGTDSKLADILKVPIGRDRFFNEIHPKLRPVETVIDGVYIAGTCQGPKNTTETIMSSLSAAAKANSLISSGQIEIEPLLAAVDPEICEWCGKCAEVCNYGAITRDEHKGKAVGVVNEALCKGCGACAPVCPVDAVDIAGYTDKEIEAMIDALAKEVNE